METGSDVAWEEALEAERGWLRALGLLGPLASRGVRRSRRVERAAEQLGRVALRHSAQLEGGFDPGPGASGRPAALYTEPGGALSGPVGVHLNQAHYRCSSLKWTGGQLLLEQGHLHSRPWPLPLAERPGAAKRHGPVRVAEVALFVSAWAPYRELEIPRDLAKASVQRGSLHFLNDQGFAVSVVPTVSGPLAPSIADVVKAAGLPFQLYTLPCPHRKAEDLARLLFPRHRRCVRWED